MVFQPAVNCAEAYVEGLVNGRTVGNRLTFEYDTVNYTQTNINELAIAVDEWFADQMKIYIPSEAEYMNTHVRGLASSLDLEADSNAGAGPGSNGTENNPVNVSFVIKFATGLTGRSGRGRAYTWGTPSGQLQANENMFLQTYATALEDAYDLLAGYVVPQGWRHVLISRYSSGVLRSPNALVIPITDYLFTDLRVDTRRKRLG